MVDNNEATPAKRAATVAGVLMIFAGLFFLGESLVEELGPSSLRDAVHTMFGIWKIISLVLFVSIAAWVGWAIRKDKLAGLVSHSGGVLRRSVSDKRIMGVCGGFARYFGIGSAMVRSLAVIALLMSPPIAMLTYFLIALLVPKDND